MDCPHETVEWDPGNHVPPYGWEIYPGYYCMDCGESIDREGMEDVDPDLEWKYQKENG